MITAFNKSQNTSIFITEASAGSGKTYALAKRYLKLILSSDSSFRDIEEILAITFTKKAAREMKERILDLLRLLALGGFSAEDDEKKLLEELGMAKKISGLKAEAALDYIISNYSNFRVQTIDSFVNSIISSCSFGLGLSAKLKVLDERAEYLAYSLDDAIDIAFRNPDIRALFDKFLDQYLYLEHKTKWLSKGDILDLLASMLGHLDVYGGEFKKYNLKETDLYEEKRKLFGLFVKLSELMPENANGHFKNAITKIVTGDNRIIDFKIISDSKSLLKDEIPLNKNGVASPDVQKLWADIKKKISFLAELESRSIFNCYIDIFNVVISILLDKASKDEVLFLNELNNKAASLISKSDISYKEISLRLGDKIKHFLIDEFQDTSDLQWKNISSLVKSAITGGGSLFYVGDRKQAIYRFRGGDSRLFDKIKNDHKNNAIVENLPLNRRSLKEIVEFNNAVFSMENLERFLSESGSQDELKQFNIDEKSDILSIFLNSHQKPLKQQNDPGKCGYVNVKSIEGENKPDRAEKIKFELITLIDGLRKRKVFKLGDIAVLCRGNDEVGLVSSWLIEHKVPVESDKTLNIKNNRFIGDIISLLKFLDSPLDNISFSSFILSEIFLKATGLKSDEISEFLFSQNKRFSLEKNFTIFREFQRRYPQIWSGYFDSLYKAVGFVGIYEIVIDIFTRFGILGNFAPYQGFFMHFIGLVKSLEDKFPSLADFLEYFDELEDKKLFVNSSDTDAIKVMTVHKAKGLGFDVVIAPFLDIDIGDLGATGKKGKVSYVIEANEDFLSLLRLDSKYARLSGPIRAAYKNEFKKAFIDELNSTYVAFTRAKKELYVFIPHGKNKCSNIARFLIPEDQKERGNPCKSENLPVKTDPSVLIPPPKFKEWIEYIKDELAKRDDVKNPEARLKGNILHEGLSMIGDLNKIGLKDALNNAFNRIEAVFPFVRDLSSHKKLIEDLIMDDKLKKFFYPDEGEVFLEKEVVNKYGDTKRIDRLIIKPKEVLIVDYKTKNDPRPSQKEQIDEYKTIIKDLCPGKKVEGYLIFIEDRIIEMI